MFSLPSFPKPLSERGHSCFYAIFTHAIAIEQIIFYFFFAIHTFPHGLCFLLYSPFKITLKIIQQDWQRKIGVLASIAVILLILGDAHKGQNLTFFQVLFMGSSFLS